MVESHNSGATSDTLYKIYLRAANGSLRDTAHLRTYITRWQLLHPLLMQSQWWVPQVAWDGWVDGYTLAELRALDRGVVAVDSMSPSWCTNLAGMLDSAQPRLLAGRLLAALERPCGDPYGASVEQLEDLVDDRDRGAAWLHSTPLYDAITSGRTRCGSQPQVAQQIAATSGGGT